MEFKASNGVRVRIDNPYLDLHTGWNWKAVGRSEETQALREFFQAERDEELGRWRWPENPDYVVYPKVGSEVEPTAGARVVHEKSGRSKDVGREVISACDAVVSVFGQAARTYFDAHPEPKPWEDAKPGDIWVLSVEGVESYAVHATAGFLGEVVFKTIAGTNVNMRSSVITDARRIWPESD